MIDIKFRLKNIHFIGIGGSGMNGLAEVLYNLGYKISGSDLSISDNTKRLSELGVNIYYHHNIKNLFNIDAVVYSSAIDNNNIELEYAKDNKIPVVPRAEMLAEIMRFRFGIAISGTHGKTTTTSLITHILTQAKLDPTYIIGGILHTYGSSNKLGDSNYLIAEADESDASFLYLQPMLSVVTNIDRDHLIAYDNSYLKLQEAFIKFIANLPFYGLCVMCVDDTGIKKIINKVNRQIISYGINNKADYMANNICYKKNTTEFLLINKNHSFIVKLNLIGKHNILNSLAAIAICLELKIATKIIAKALANFSGIKRRLDYKGSIIISRKNIIIFDDYAHHPNAISMVVNTFEQAYANNRLVVIFQPHRYSRLQDLFDDFAKELSQIKVLILLPVYSAKEHEIANINSTSLANLIRARSNNKVIVAKNLIDSINIFINICQHNDILLTMGAGDVGDISNKFIYKYANNN